MLNNLPTSVVLEKSDLGRFLFGKLLLSSPDVSYSKGVDKPL